MESKVFTYIIIIGVAIFGLYVLFFFVPLSMWITAQISGVRISLLDLIYMRIRRVAPSPIVKSMIMAAKAGFEVELEALEAHSMAGGDVEKVVSSMIIAQKKNDQLSFNEACKSDLAQQDLTKK
jgi:uncharacterized protein YqfA (UPF0365 family)